RLEMSHPESVSYEEIARQVYEVFGNSDGYEVAPEKQEFGELFIPDSKKSFELLNYWPKISMSCGLEMIKSTGSPEKFGPMDVS
ncbi:hypothetical protein N8198_04410, partial [Gammaproteobacteria bacterium]|nr:hypothetical protein [Gammaproteobacteria bacterium]